MGSERGMKTHQMSLCHSVHTPRACCMSIGGVNKNGTSHRPAFQKRSVAWSATRTLCWLLQDEEERGRGWRCIQLRYTRIVRQTDRDRGRGARIPCPSPLPEARKVQS